MIRPSTVRRVVPARRRPTPTTVAILLGALVTTIATCVAIVRQIEMSIRANSPGAHDVHGTDHGADASPGSGPASPWSLHSMAMSDMPEMWISAIGLLVVIAAAVRNGPAPAGRSGSLTGRRGRWALITVLGLALTIDISKTSTLGFVIPGMRAEYGLGPQAASLLAVAGLTGTAFGALLCALATDRIGPRRTYLVCTLAFASTSTCGSMPTFQGNLVMCLLMGLSVGGLAPLLITLLSDALPGVRRGSITTCVSLAALAAGFLVAAASALWLEPMFGWRVLWLIGAPAGIALALAVPVVPATRGRPTNAGPPASASSAGPADHARALPGWMQGSYAAVVGLVGFGLTTWLPTLTRAVGLDVTAANRLLVLVSLGTLPLAGLLVVFYPRLGPGRLLAVLSIASAVLLGTLVWSGSAGSASGMAVAILGLSLFVVNCMTAVFLPVAADLSAAAERARTTGMVSLCNRVGGLLGPLLLAGLVASVSDVLTFVAVAAAGCAALSVLILRRVRAQEAAA